MRRPLAFVHGNLVFGRDLSDCWALYRLQTEPYAGMARAQKLELLGRLAGVAYALEADFQLLRVTRAWSCGDYERGVWAQAGGEHADRRLLAEHLSAHGPAIEEGSARPELYLAVALERPGETAEDPIEQADVGARLAELVRRARAACGLSDPRGLSTRALQGFRQRERTVLGRIGDYVVADRAATHELRWLIARAPMRAVAEPEVDARFVPQALVIEADEGGGQVRPLEHDVLRLCDQPIERRTRSLRVLCETGESHQALLVAGALAEETPFPGRGAELMFAPLEAVGFPVDACLHAGNVANADAVRLIRRRIVDADHAFAEESAGDHGPSANASERPRAARELEDYLTAAERPPLLRAQLSLCVSASSEAELEERVERLRAEYRPVELHRPLGDQLAMFCSHLPGQRAPVRAYDDYMTVEQVGAMVPAATHAVGSEYGPYIGHTLSGSAQPVLFDPTEASRTARAPAVLLSGTLGSGKTMTLELIAYQALLCGSAVVDIDPKGDHRLDLLPGVAERMEAVELGGSDQHAGMLDPLRIAPEQTREDLAVAFLSSILPEPVRPEWRTEIRLAVQLACAAGSRSCAEVLDRLEGSDTEDARAAARSLRAHAASGLARLGFAQPTDGKREPGRADVTSLRIRDLQLPLPGTPRSELLEEERVGQAILRLLAVYALALTSRDASRHAVLCFDEAWVLLADSQGRALVDRISRLGRAQNVTPLLATQALSDVVELEPLIGCAFCFGVETDREAERALELLRLDTADERLRSQLVGYRQGRCLMRDYDGRVAGVQIDLADRRMLAALDTTPRAQAQEDPERAASLA